MRISVIFLLFFLVRGNLFALCNYCDKSKQSNLETDEQEIRKQIKQMERVKKITQPGFIHMEGAIYSDPVKYDYYKHKFYDNFKKAKSNPIAKTNSIEQDPGFKCYLSNEDLNIEGLKRCDTKLYQITSLEKTGLDLKVNHCKTGKKHDINFKYYFSLQDMTKLKRYKIETKELIDRCEESFKYIYDFSYYRAEKSISQFLGIILTNPIPMRNVSLLLDERISYRLAKDEKNDKLFMLKENAKEKKRVNTRHTGNYNSLLIQKKGYITNGVYVAKKYDIYKDSELIYEIKPQYDGGHTFFVPLMKFDSNGISYTIFLCSDAIDYHFCLYFLYNGNGYFVPVRYLCGYDRGPC